MAGGREVRSHEWRENRRCKSATQDWEQGSSGSAEGHETSRVTVVLWFCFFVAFFSMCMRVWNLGSKFIIGTNVNFKQAVEWREPRATAQQVREYSAKGGVPSGRRALSEAKLISNSNTYEGESWVLGVQDQPGDPISEKRRSPLKKIVVKEKKIAVGPECTPR